MPKSNIFLIGLMGSGKSTVGAALSTALQKECFDLDVLVEVYTQKTIAAIFAEEGENIFRDHEEHVIETITQNNNIILATGGGAVLREKNRTALKTRGQVFYLSTPVDVLLKRVQSALDHRPLLQVPNPREKLASLLQQREALYLETAHHVISTENKTVEMICDEITRFLK